VRFSRTTFNGNFPQTYHMLLRHRGGFPARANEDDPKMSCAVTLQVYVYKYAAANSCCKARSPLAPTAFSNRDCCTKAEQF
jgi:hypothetical protein